MKKKLLSFYTSCSIIFLVFIGYSNAQVQHNCMSFDGVNDYISAANASGLIAGGTGITMTCWAYIDTPLTNNTNYNGLLGFRNNTNADFYMLQLANGNMEARFRNSAGTAYTISRAVTRYSWQHFALTYDGSKLRFFVNGAMTDSIIATGTITNATIPFLMGKTFWNTTQFMLHGKLDEVSLWNKGLKYDEVYCAYKSTIDTSKSGLLLYYDFNQGVAGGNNTSITSVKDSRLNINASIIGMPLTGNGSNFVQGVDNATLLNQNICQGQTFNFVGQPLSNSGFYVHRYPGSNSCDSVVELNLDVTNLTATQQGNSIQAAQAGATYQWFDCSTNQIISGATAQTYSPSNNGNYAAIVTTSNCTDTTNCVPYIFVGISKVDDSELQLFPNPANSELFINMTDMPINSSYSIINIEGQIILSGSIRNAKQPINISNLSKGIYFVQINSDNYKQIVRKFTKL